tara:strand:- start:479 stop:1546 length:1068 start_codon:yes stop_codon:yes gene_type:complete
VLNLRASQINIDKKVSIEYLEQLPSNDYIIGPGDTLAIIISRDLGLSNTVTVDGEGTINLPKIERIYVSGLTINELNLLLNEAYLKYVKFPKVETIINRYRPIRVFVDGEVVSPGLQIMDGSLSLRQSNQGESNLSIFSKNTTTSSESNNFYFPTVFDAIRASGGITQYSNLKNIQIIRKDNISNGSGKITTKLNFEDFLTLGENSQNIRIYDSDIIKVERGNEPNTNILTKAILSNLNPRFINVFVTGRVNRPGSQTVSRASVLSDAVDMAGGAKIMRGPVTFIRFESDGRIDKRKFKLTKNKRGKYSNPNLRNGDLIIVGDSLITATSEVIQEFTSPFVGILSTYGLIKAIND